MTETLTHLLGWIRPLALVRWVAYLAIAVVLWVVLNYSVLQEYFSARDRRMQYEQQVARLQKTQSDLQSEHRAIKAGGFPAEKAIRERLLMVKPGEKVIFIETPETTQPSRMEGETDAEPRAAPPKPEPAPGD